VGHVEHMRNGHKVSIGNLEGKDRVGDLRSCWRTILKWNLNMI